MKLGFIGMGNMAGALLRGFLACGKIKAENVFVFDKNIEKLEKERCRCRQWLQESIEAGKDRPKAMSAFDMLDVRCDDITRMFNDRFADLYAELKKHGIHIQPSEPPKPESWLKRKIKGGIRCYKENGLVYTVKLLFRKISNKFRKG